MKKKTNLFQLIWKLQYNGIKFIFKGTCEDLEKPYYRLTGLPDPNTIRPEHVLKKALNHILEKWKNY